MAKKSPRSASVGRLFERRGRRVKSRRRRESTAARQVERLEDRRVMAFQFVSAFAQSGTPFYVSGVTTGTPELNEAPQQVTLRFGPGVTIDPATLGVISVTRSGKALDAFGSTGLATDVAVVPGSIVVDDTPNGNQVIVRFAENLPDDSYQISIGAGLRSKAGDSLAAPVTLNVRLDLGAHVVSVVPQPVARGLDGKLTQSRDTIEVYFNSNDPLDEASAETASLYRLIRMDAAGADVGTVNPTGVVYDAAVGKAVLTFAAGAIADDQLFRLEIGGAAAVVAAAPVTEAADDTNSRFFQAQDLGALGASGATVDGAIDLRPTVSTPTGGALRYPSQPGTIDEPGHRDTPVDSGAHGEPYATVDPALDIVTIQYNFQDHYGDDPQGNPLHNVITEAQKQRAREIFELYSLYAGVRFVETADQGITVATGDLRAFAPDQPTTPAGLGGGQGALMNSQIDWGQSEYGGGWFSVAMHEIGHALGLQHSIDVSSIMGGGVPDAVYPGNYDIEHVRQLAGMAPTSNDIDLYKFNLAEAGTLTAQTFVARPGQGVTSLVDTVVSLFREDGGRRTLIARNDNSYGRDSFLRLDLEPGTYYVAVTSTGNTDFNPEVADSGYGGRTQGAYQLNLGFVPATVEANTIVDTTGKPLDGDRDGAAGGVFKFWFNTASTANTIFVDKANTGPGTGDGSLGNPYKTISAATAAAGATTRVIRIAGNAAGAGGIPLPYLIGLNAAGRALADGATLNVPAGVTVMIDAGAVFKLGAAVIDVGSSSELVSRAGAALQVLGTPGSSTVFTSLYDDTIGGISDGFPVNAGPAVTAGQWGGIVLRQDSDAASKLAFVNSISGATFRYGGGKVRVDGQLENFASIQLEDTRPTILFNTITDSAGAAIAATPNSFEDTTDRVGPELRGNVLTGNSINGLFVKIDTEFGTPLEQLDVPARFRSTDIVYVIQENLVITGGAGGYLEVDGVVTARQTGRLTIDPGVVVKLQGSRIELERGIAQLIAEGTASKPVIFTSLGDNRYGAGGTFDTNGAAADKFEVIGGLTYGIAVGGMTVGDWGGIVLNAGSMASIDHAYVAFGGGVTPIEGSFDGFNVIETHQGDLRLANSRLEYNAAGSATTGRNGRGTNASATVFVNGAQPIIVGNDFRSNLGAVISINANSLADVSRPDVGRSTGPIDRFAQYDDNLGPLVRGNLITAAIDPDSRRTGGFNITLSIDPTLPGTVIAAAQAAATRWETVIVGDLANMWDDARGQWIDDVLITVQAGLLGAPVTDGVGGVLGKGGPVQTRPANGRNPGLPYIGQVGLDLADVNTMDLETVMIHEIGHALGFPSVVDAKGYIQGANYVGVNALREYQELGGTTAFVPIETGGDGGTAFAHWSEATFGSEVMTGWAGGGFSPLSTVTIGAFADMGYTVNYAAADPFILPANGGRYQSTAGMVVRGGEITVEGVWDDTDIVHVVQGEIVVNNFHTATGMRLVSRPDASLVVKLDGATAGFTAAGSPLDIDDRIGGTVQILGQPGYPVILTSLKDDTVGASLDPLGRTVTDTNGDAAASIPAAGDWRGLQFQAYSNDRNVGLVSEAEQPLTGGADTNDATATAEWIGVLAPNYPTGTASFDSAQEKSGDENRRMGFEVHGQISPDAPGDVDVYSFTGYPGSTVWIDIDKTAASLDSMVELLDGSGRVLARSIDAQAEGGVIQAEEQTDDIGGTTVTYQLQPGGVLLPGMFSVVPGTLVGTLYDAPGGDAAPVAIQTFSFDADGIVHFSNILGSDKYGAPLGAAGTATGAAIGGTVDMVNGTITFTFNGPTGIGANYIEVRYAYQTTTFSTATLGDLYKPLGQSAVNGADFYSLNPRDPGMCVVLPGTQGRPTQYFIRVRSQKAYNTATAPTQGEYEADLRNESLIKDGATAGRYELRVRLRQRDEKPGSTVIYADIRYPTTGIDVLGLPRNSLLLGELGESGAVANDTFANAQYIGNVLQSDRNAISVAGSIAGENDIDWYTFAINYENIQAIPGINDTGQTFAAMFDLDYADGFRGDLSFAVFDGQGTLLYISRDSNIANDQPGAGQGTDFADLARASLGKLDPFLSTVTLGAGVPDGVNAVEDTPPKPDADPARQLRYYVAVFSNKKLPTQLDAMFNAGSGNVAVRLEPLASVARVVNNGIGAAGPNTIVDTANLTAHVTPFTLSDVTLFVSTATGLQTVDAMKGGVETIVSSTLGSNDIVMRSDGKLYGYRGLPGVADTAGTLDLIDSGTGARTTVGNDDIPNLIVATTPTLTENNLFAREAGVGTLSTFQLAHGDLLAATLSGTLQYTGTVDGFFTTGTWIFTTDALGVITFTDIIAPVGLAAPVLGTVDPVNGIVSVTWSSPVLMNNVLLTTTTYTYNVPGDPNSITTDNVDALAWQRTGVGQYANLFLSVREGALSRLYRANPATGSAEQAVGQPWGRIGTHIQDAGNSLGLVTGMAFDGDTLYGVDDLGHFFTIDPATAVATNVITIAGAPAFAGLAIGPQNLYGGTLAHVLFAIDAGGTLRALDTAGNLQTVFDSLDANGDPGSDGIADATSIATGVGGATGLAFSPLDINLWHDTVARADGGGTPMYFGLENTAAQFGGSVTWQADLLSNAAIAGTYNLPGGAYGSLTTDSFSLTGYDYTDKPTLYFSYWLQTDDAAGGGQDRARAFVSIDGGLTWELLATNSNAGELPGIASVSSRITGVNPDVPGGVEPNQKVQQLYDTANWRQVRVDLGEFAGQADIRLRFDFTTAGVMDPAAVWRSTKTVVDAPTTTTVTFADVSNLVNPDLVLTLVARDGTVLANVVNVDADTNTVTLDTDVMLAAGDVVTFVDAGGGHRLNNIVDNVNAPTPPGPQPGVAATAGNFNGATRGQNNRFEGFYIDRLIVGFAERGEQVTGAAPAQTGFTDLVMPDTPVQVLEGEYQLEIRRGTEVVDNEVFDTNDPLVASSTTNSGLGPKLGDSNQPREQGQLLIQGNIISNAANYGISIDAAARDANTRAPIAGVPRNFATLNANRLAPGAVVMNNVIAGSGTAGILFSGDPNAGNVPAAAVPFGRIVNNTIYGARVETRSADLVAQATVITITAGTGTTEGITAGMTVTGPGIPANTTVVFVNSRTTLTLSNAATLTKNNLTLSFSDAAALTTGVSVTDNAGPTLLNNIFANLARGVSIDGTSTANTVVGMSAYWNTATQVTGVTESGQLVLSGDPFVNASARNFYLVKDSRAIDSALGSLQDRATYRVVTSPLGIPASPILAPDRDFYGQLRGDDPSVAPPSPTQVPGLGVNVFKDRGAIDRVDFTQPWMTLVNPLDQGATDLNVDTDAVTLTDALGVNQFTLQLNDVGVGMDKSTVQSGAFTVTRNGVTLVEGADYVFRYLEKSNQIVFEAASVYSFGTYLITATSRPSTSTVTGYLTDLANNPILSNKADGSTSFEIHLVGAPDAPVGLTGTPGENSVTLTWQPPANDGGDAITDYVVQYSTDATSWMTFTDGVSTATSATVTGLTNGTAYYFRVAAKNSSFTGPYAVYAAPSATTPTPITPQPLPPDAPTDVTGASGDRQVIVTWTAPAYAGTQPITDYEIEYSSDAGFTTWTPFTDGVSTATTATVTGLVNGTAYLFRVRAKNIRGASPWAVSADSVTPLAAAAAPTGVVGTRGDSQVTVGWTAPADNGGSAISDYLVQYRTDVVGSAWQSFADDTSPALTAVVTGLVNGTAYRFRVAAVTAFGTGTWSLESAAVTPIGPAAAPTGVTATPGDRQVSLAWTAPSNTGGSAISDYVIEYSTNAGITWTPFTDGVSTGTTATVTGLVNGTSYRFRVAAVTVVGTGTFSTETTTVMPVAGAAAPGSLTARRRDQRVTLEWIAPTDDGGLPITDYIVQYRTDAADSTWQTFADGTSPATIATMTWLLSGTNYRFRVAAVTAFGTGAWSAEVASIAPATPPGPPRSVAGVPGEDRVSLTWLAPSTIGIAPITDYAIQYSTDGGAHWTPFSDSVSTSTSAEVTGLTSGVGYIFRVAAVDKYGNGPYSVPSALITPQRLPPAAPTSVKGTSGPGQAIVTWTAPTFAGTQPITDYEVEFSSNAGTNWTRFNDGTSTATAATVTGLTNGTAYLFRVRAVNNNGPSPWARSVSSVTPLGAATSPTDVTGIRGDRRVTLSWAAPADTGGSVITDYVIQYRADVVGSAWQTFSHSPSTARTATVTGLVNGTSYRFRVAAVTTFGRGAWSAESAVVTPLIAATAPTGVTGTRGDRQVSLAWTAPSNTGGSAISDYVIQYRTNVAGSAWQTFTHVASTSTRATVTGLANGTSYRFRVAAVTGFGTGAFSTESAAVTPLAAALAPTDVVGTRGDRRVTLSWAAPADTGGSAITDYVIQFRTDVVGSTWQTFSDGPSTARTATVTGLVNGTSYRFRVAAVTTFGTGAWSVESAVVMPLIAATAPTGLTATRGDRQASLAWTAPSNTGGSAISDYVIQYRTNVSGSAWQTFTHVASTSTRATVTGLVNGTSYRFRVAAVTDFGTGAFSTESAAVTPLAPVA